MTSVSELLKSGRFQGSSSYKHAEFPHRDFTLDFSDPTKRNVYTSVDCYVSGTYFAKGRVFNVTQRYSVFVSYNKETRQHAMLKVRDQVMQDFQHEYPELSISDVFIPENKFGIPMGGPPGSQPTEFYQGSDLWKRMSRFDVARYKLSVEKEIYKSRTDNIRKKYGV